VNALRSEPRDDDAPVGGGLALVCSETIFLVRLSIA